MHEAILYERLEDGSVRCSLCSFRCRIPDGGWGNCRVRYNRGGVLSSVVYGRLIARHMDPIEKKPLYHFLPGTLSYSIATPGCNFRCSFCQNWQISQPDPDTAFERISYVKPEEVVRRAVAGGAHSISYTYTEPTIFMEYALDCARLAKDEGLRNVFVTNGFQTPEAIEKMRGLIDAANVDLKAFSDEFYRTRCKARLEPVLEAIRCMVQAGMHIEVTTLVIPGLNDSPEQLRGIAEFLAGLSTDLPWHISRFHPDYKETHLSPTPISTLKQAAAFGKEAGLKYIYLGNVLIEEGRDTCCPSCGKVLIERRGFGWTVVNIKEPKCPSCGADIPVVLAS